MNRILLAASLVLVTAVPSFAQAMGDFDCVSNLNGPDTPAGTLRIDDPNSFAFLDPATATPGPSYPMDMIDDEQVNFDDAFADHVSSGAIMAEASWFEDADTFEAVIVTKKGKPVLVSCPFIP